MVRTEGIVISAEAPEAVEMEETEEEKESPDQIGEFYLQMKGMNYFGLLGVEQSAQDPEVEQAYRDRMNGFERANFSARMDPELEMKLEEINTEIIKAYESLRNQERREQYLAKLRPPEKSGAPSRGLEAEKYLQEGIKSVRARDWGNAQKMFEKAVELRPDEPEYFGYLGWSIYSNPEFKLESRREMAKGKIRQAIKMNPNMDSVHVFLGKILKDEGKKDQAIQEFREALRCNANCREAKRELEAQGLKG